MSDIVGATARTKQATSIPTYDDLTTFLLQRIQPKRILDIGCGEGRYADMVRAAGLSDTELIGVECDPHWQQHLLDKGYSEVRMQGGLELMNNPSETFDLVILGDVIEHFRKSDGQDLLEYLTYRSAYVLVVTPEAYLQNFPSFYESHNSIWRPEAMQWHDLWAHCRSKFMHFYLLRGYLRWDVPHMQELVAEANAQTFMLGASLTTDRPRALTLHDTVSKDPIIENPNTATIYRPI